MSSLESKLLASLQKVEQEKADMEQYLRELERRLLTPRSVVKVSKMKLYLN